METHEGIAILVSNLGKNIDEAFHGTIAGIESSHLLRVSTR